LRAARLDPAQAQQGPEGVVAEPGPAGLAGEALAQQLDLALAALGLQGHEQVGLAEVALVLGDLVLQDQVAAEGVPGQLGHQPVVLVAVLQAVGEDQVGVDLGLEPLEALLHGPAVVGEEAVPEPLHGDPGPAGALEERGRAVGRLLGPPAGPAQHQPVHGQPRVLGHQPQDGPAAADLDVVGVGPDGQDPQGPGRVAGQAQAEHTLTAARRPRPAGPSPAATPGAAGP
jgi:hypothetical protein